MKNFILITYAWLTTILFGGVIVWLATVPGLDTGTGAFDEIIKVVFRMTLYAIFFILFYRSIIMSLKTTVDRLSKWRSKSEEIEDAEFVLVIETLVVIITIFGTTIFAIIDEAIQMRVQARSSEIKDILISIMSILLTSILVYSQPIVGELEIAIKQKFKRGIFAKK